MINQCNDCGGFCKRSGCERENVKPTPKRKPLTDEEINDRARAEGAHNADFWLGVRFAEATHGIKE